MRPMTTRNAAATTTVVTDGAAAPSVRLTSLAHGGGCGCKLAPSVLQDILRGTPLGLSSPSLLVGTETSDDAAVYRLDAERAVVLTTDFFTPIVDDPFDFGRIAATNALSDVFAMGGRPLLALAVLGMPVGKLEIGCIRQIAAGGAAVCEAAGIPLAGGHSIDTPEPIYGLVALGHVHPDRVLRNSTARPGDLLVLTKRLGIGIYSAALRRGELGDQLYAEMIASTTQLNSIGAELAGLPGVHAVTDVTGFGLLGHALEMCRGSGVGATLDWSALPFLPGVMDLARGGIHTGASGRNWASYGHEAMLPAGFAPWRRDLLCDPQTSGGLLIAIAPEGVKPLLRRLADTGHERARVIGALSEGAARVMVREA